jgi:hypothetical protein
MNSIQLHYNVNAASGDLADPVTSSSLCNKTASSSRLLATRRRRIFQACRHRNGINAFGARGACLVRWKNEPPNLRSVAYNAAAKNRLTY